MSSHGEPPIKSVIECSFVDWPGNICMTLFLGGCNFRCPYCHNRYIVINSEAIPNIKWDYIRTKIKRGSPFLDGICISGGEPTIYPDLIDLIIKIKKMGLAIKLDTNGTNPSLLSKMINLHLLDYVSMDVKAPLDMSNYRRATGIYNVPINLIKESISLLKNSDIDYEFRTTVVPGIHDNKDIEKMSVELKGASHWRIQNFRPTKELPSPWKDIRPFNKDEFDDLVSRFSW